MKILICGATGSIGTQAIEVLKNSNHSIVGFLFNKNKAVMGDILKSFSNVFVYSPNDKELSNVDSLEELFIKTNPDVVLNAVTGFAGLQVTLMSLKYKKDVLLANKESLVVAGWFVMSYAKKHNLKIIPIDSEHSAIYDLLKNNNKKVKQIIITASGGPFYNHSKEELENIKFEEAIKHPKWNMGYKISIDSSTLINKCFELLEASHLFNSKNIKAVYHRQAMVHGMLEFEDNSIFMCMSNNDMKLPISQAISFFENNLAYIKPLEFNNLNLNFEEIDENKWKPIKWAKQIIESENRTLPIIINAANEEAIELFKNDQIKYLQIIDLIEMCIDEFSDFKVNTIKDVYLLDSIIRKHIKDLFDVTRIK